MELPAFSPNVVDPCILPFALPCTAASVECSCARAAAAVAQTPPCACVRGSGLIAKWGEGMRGSEGILTAPESGLGSEQVMTCPTSVAGRKTGHVYGQSFMLSSTTYVNFI